MKKYEIILPCHFGLESVLKREVIDIGYDVTKVEDGRVTFLGDEEAIARTLYTILREFDDEDVSVIYSESFAECNMGQAIMNRLLKAAGHQIVYV